MYAAGEGNVVTIAHQLTHGAVAWQRGSDGEAELNVAGGRFGQHVVYIPMQGLIIKAIKMAVGVD